MLGLEIKMRGRAADEDSILVVGAWAADARGQLEMNIYRLPSLELYLLWQPKAKLQGMPVQKLVLCVGAAGVGKTSLLRRFVGEGFEDITKATLGVEELPSRVVLDPVKRHETLPEELVALLPSDGLEIEFLEVGGREHCRQLRGRQPDALLVCFSHQDRATFHAAKHQLLHYRLERHLACEHAGINRTPTSVTVPRLSVVLCGTNADATCEHSVCAEELSTFSKLDSVYAFVSTSAKTGEGVLTALHRLAEGLCEAEEEHLAEIALMGSNCCGHPCMADAAEAWHWSLPLVAETAMTQPRGLRPHEPDLNSLPESKLVEVFSSQDFSPYGARVLPYCLQRGLLHRAVHVWLCDFGTGSLLLRQYANSSEKNSCLWGPSIHTEVRSYAGTSWTQSPPAPFVSEGVVMACARALKEQIGLEWEPRGGDLWFSCANDAGHYREMLDVFVMPVQDGVLPPLQLKPSEQVQWVHFLDVFGEAGASCQNLVAFEPTYRSNMLQRLWARIVHAYCELE